MADSKSQKIWDNFVHFGIPAVTYSLNCSQAWQGNNHPLGFFFLCWFFSQHLSLNLLLVFEYWVTLLGNEENLFEKQWVNNMIGTLKSREPCCVHTRPMPLAVFKSWGSHLLGALPSPTGAVPQELHPCQPIVFHCFKTWRWSETTADIDPTCWSFEEEGCVWMLALENSNYWSPRLAAVFFYQWGIEVRSWHCVSLVKMEDYLFICGYKPICHNIKNQDFRELLEYDYIVSLYREVLIVCPQQQLVSEALSYHWLLLSCIFGIVERQPRQVWLWSCANTGVQKGFVL